MPRMLSGPLAGYVIGVTADRRAGEQIQLLEQRGAECLHGPVIRTHPLGPEEDLERATKELIARPPEFVLLTTGIGVRGWLEAAEALHLADDLLDALFGATVYARGPKAAGAALTGGIEVTWSSPDARSAALVAQLATQDVAGARVAVQLDGALGAELCRAIEALGAEPVPVPVYRWSLPDDVGPAVRLVRAVVDGRVDAVTFTARPAIDNLLEIAAEVGLVDEVMARLGGDVAVFCVGPVCSAHARDVGIAPVEEPARARLGALVQHLTTWFGGRDTELELAGHAVRLHGRVVTVDGGDPVRLSERERGLLSALAARPGAVHSKRTLLRAVWGGTEADEHVVEVTIGRLRQRLGPAGEGIETVVRRGYRLSPL
ncbi:uroporphyrinogen-III synthase [Actinomarinicola tropica]|uniref:Uroporphyrinogen-III synthase n=2 Tax=Actinomarinicola tropica TaxID=2789776 RepID=A0A5Q2RHX6_9ACTN|nr:uroporphyrinogen-III synthase [Actinomarinicola tropica]